MTDFENEELEFETLLKEEEEKEEVAKKKTYKNEKPSSKKISAKRISGIGNGGFIMFRGDDILKFRLVPSSLWNGGDTQEFDEKEFQNFSKPVFYKGK